MTAPTKMVVGDAVTDVQLDPRRVSVHHKDVWFSI